jgi:hypothetical protein
LNPSTPAWYCWAHWFTHASSWQALTHPASAWHAQPAGVVLAKHASIAVWQFALAHVSHAVPPSGCLNEIVIAWQVPLSPPDPLLLELLLWPLELLLAPLLELLLFASPLDELPPSPLS